MKRVFKILYGDLNIRKKSDYIIVPLKVLYLIFSIPFLIIILGLFLRSFGTIGTSKNEKFGVVKKILFHFADVFWSFALWGVLISQILKQS